MRIETHRKSSNTCGSSNSASVPSAQLTRSGPSSDVSPAAVRPCRGPVVCISFSQFAHSAHSRVPCQLIAADATPTCAPVRAGETREGWELRW